MLRIIDKVVRENVDPKLREFAEFLVVDKDGEPTEEYVIFSQSKWLPENLFRRLLGFFKEVGLHFRPEMAHWTIEEGLHEEALQKLQYKLNKLPEQFWLCHLEEAA